MLSRARTRKARSHVHPIAAAADCCVAHLTPDGLHLGHRRSAATPRALSLTTLSQISRYQGSEEMKRRWPPTSLLVLVLLMSCLAQPADAAKGGRGGGRRGGRGGRPYGIRMPILIPNRTPGAANYYENKDGAKITKASHFELDYMLGRKITFFCAATGIPRPEITWFKDGVELYHHQYFQTHEWIMGNDTIKSKMEIDPATQKDAGYYECQADNQYSVDRRGFRTDYVMANY